MDAGLFGWSRFSTVGDYVCWGATCNSIPVVKDPTTGAILKNNKAPGGIEPYAKIVRVDLKECEKIVG